jgi:hypothetical protein
MKKTEELKFDTAMLVALRGRPIQTALDLVSEISCTVLAALPQDIAEIHIEKIRLALGELRRYFGSVWLGSLPIEWLLAVAPEKVARNASMTGSCLDFRERVHRIRLVQFHACAFGIHAPSAFKMLLIEACAAKLRRGPGCPLQCTQDQSGGFQNPSSR